MKRSIFWRATKSATNLLTLASERSHSALVGLLSQSRNHTRGFHRSGSIAGLLFRRLLGGCSRVRVRAEDVRSDDFKKLPPGIRNAMPSPAADGRRTNSAQLRYCKSAAKSVDDVGVWVPFHALDVRSG